jgi:hypothetical protein
MCSSEALVPGSDAVMPVKFACFVRGGLELSGDASVFGLFGGFLHQLTQGGLVEFFFDRA